MSTKAQGVVLCGGKSSRMGSDKGLMKAEQLTWSESALTKLSLLRIPVTVSINNDQRSLYEKVFSPNILVPDALNIGGPLNGILSVHLQYPGYDLLVLACDLVKLDPMLVRRLFDEYRIHGNRYDYYVYSTRQGLEPLCGIYTSQALKGLYENVQSGRLRKFGLKNFLLNGNTLITPCEETHQEQFMNFNDPGTLIHLSS